MEDSKPVGTLVATGCKLSKDDESLEVDHTMFRSMISSFLYVTTTRPDMMQFLGLVTRFQSAPKETHATTVKIIFRYMKGTMRYGLWYPKGNDFSLNIFTDADWEGSIDDRKSTSGSSFYLGNYLVSCLCKKQSSVSFSTA